MIVVELTGLHFPLFCREQIFQSLVNRSDSRDGSFRFLNTMIFNT